MAALATRVHAKLAVVTYQNVCLYVRARIFKLFEAFMVAACSRKLARH